MAYNPLEISSTLDSSEENSNTSSAKKTARKLPDWIENSRNELEEKNTQRPEEEKKNKSTLSKNSKANETTTRTKTTSPSKTSSSTNEIYIMSDEDLLEVARLFKKN